MKPNNHDQLLWWPKLPDLEECHVIKLAHKLEFEHYACLKLETAHAPLYRQRPHLHVMSKTCCCLSSSREIYASNFLCPILYFCYSPMAFEQVKRVNKQTEIILNGFNLSSALQILAIVSPNLYHCRYIAQYTNNLICETDS